MNYLTHLCAKSQLYYIKLLLLINLSVLTTLVRQSKGYTIENILCN